jgi:DNA replication protein DnaC
MPVATFSRSVIIVTNEALPILTSRLPIAHWHEQIGDPSVADSILDRLIHNAYRLELNGESMRKKRGRKPGDEESK